MNLDMAAFTTGEVSGVTTVCLCYCWQVAEGDLMRELDQIEPALQVCWTQAIHYDDVQVHLMMFTFVTQCTQTVLTKHSQQMSCNAGWSGLLALRLSLDPAARARLLTPSRTLYSGLRAAFPQPKPLPARAEASELGAS